MQFNDITLLISAVDPKQYPQDGLSEIVLSGRSNVGKSSLINTLLSRKALARTSSKPGKTQTLNFYQIEKQLIFVDVPGYGYAKVSKQQRERFGQIIETYLQTREVLQGAVLLVDARHEPTEDDFNMYNYLKYYDLPVLVVATKVDKIKRSQHNKQTKIIKQKLQFDPSDQFVFFSAETKVGHDEIWQWIKAHTQVDFVIKSVQ
ncbi:YihA family ribosome biogenesis GTP-binding protein [Lactobacillus sp. CC-MHH1034]|uniref:ribosome biogenesis GTP-binding protein YihA/YsxC n=1 Tax=Agrilactobacillus fermenti TaxID=2586909 RepID=UPI001E2AFD37|nr:ribosome biogenesis GTP-binding protein YihA/YsxC [Agrilactobacillus fermenti]MCD2255247.1 YihA family ribosome biogenesis GTP-binding protein [Agrilactobacillus fermenti]